MRADGMQEFERALIQRDGVIDGLPIVLDEALMLETLKSLRPEDKFQSAQKQYIRYKKGTNCIVKYHCVTAEQSRDYYAKAYREQDEDKLAKVTALGRVENAQNVEVLEAAHLALFRFPYDGKLKPLPLLFDKNVQATIINRALFRNDWVDVESIETLQYKPERRFVAKLKLSDGNKAVLKMYTHERFQTAVLSNRHRLRGEHLISLIGRSQKQRILLYEWVEGESLTKVYQDSTFDVENIFDCGKELGNLHQTKGKYVQAKNDNEFACSLEELANGISYLIPALAEQAQALASELNLAVQSLVFPHSVIHGDFYSKQVLITEEGVKFIDLDDVSVWHSGYDIGVFIAHLERDYLLGLLPETLLIQYSKLLFDGYTSVRYLEAEQVELFTAVALFQLAHHPFRNGSDNWEKEVRRIMAAAQSRLKRYHQQKTHNASTTPSQLVDEAMPFLKDIADRSRLAPRLLASLSDTIHHAENYVLTGSSVIRHKVGKRILFELNIENRLSGDRMVMIGKARAKGLDRRTYQLNHFLYHNRFSPDSEDGIQVPRPLGCIRPYQMWLQEKVAGETIFEPFCSEQGKSVAVKAACAIYKLHTMDTEIVRRHTIEDELSILESNLDKVSAKHSEWKPELTKIMQMSRSISKKLPFTHASCIHRDFYHDQLLIDGKKLYLLDLDLCSLGDPALDIGNFVAHIQEQCLRLKGDLDYAHDQIEVFLETYQKLIGKDTRQSVKIYTILSFVRHIFISQRIHERQPFTRQIIEYCHEELTQYLSEKAR